MLRGVAVGALLLCGCGPIDYVTIVTFQASKAVSQAKRSDAEKLAPYEYTLAVEELHKARELAGFARWQQAIAIGRAALDHGRAAESKAIEKASHPDDKNE